VPDSNLPETLSWYRDSVKWAVGLSSAALLGAAGALDKVQKSPKPFQLLFGLFVVASALSLLCAGIYYFALTNFGNTYERAQRLWKRVQGRGDFNPQALETDDALAHVANPDDLREVALAYRDAKRVYRRLHGWTKWSLFATVFLVPVVLISAVCATNVPEAAKPLPPHYSIAISGSHRGADGKMHVHTFLLSDNTGEVWQMVCEGPNRVEFVRVPVEGLEIPPKTSP